MGHGAAPTLYFGWLRWVVVTAPEQAAQNHIEHRDEEEVENGGEQHAADDGGAHGAATQRARAGGEDQRQNAENEGERGHQNGPQTQLAGLSGCVSDGASLAAQLLSKLDNQNRVFRRESNEHDQADLAVDIVGEAAQRDQAQRAEHRHGHSQKNDEGQREALVLRREGEIHDQDAERENDKRFAAGFDLIERQAGPFVLHSGHQYLVAGQLLHGGASLS